MNKRKYQGIIISPRKDVRERDFSANYYSLNSKDDYDSAIEKASACVWYETPISWEAITKLGRKKISNMREPLA